MQKYQYDIVVVSTDGEATGSRPFKACDKFQAIARASAEWLASDVAWDCLILGVPATVVYAL